MTTPPLDEHGLPHGYRFDPDWELTPRQLCAMRQRGEAMLVLDCRELEEARIAEMGADLLVPMRELGQRLDELEPHRQRRIVVHCHHGVRSLHVAMALRQRGFVEVKSLAGGIDLWSRDVDPSVPRY